MKLWLALSCCVGLLGCAAEEDESMYLTGTEEYAVHEANGSWSCESPKKVLICHIPPGNPDNAHNICVSTHAVEPHETHHGDFVGACEAQPPDDGGDDGDDGGDCGCPDDGDPPPD